MSGLVAVVTSVLPAGVEALFVGLLLVVLVQQEIVRAIDGERARRWARRSNRAVVPLLGVFAVIIGGHLLKMM